MKNFRKNDQAIPGSRELDAFQARFKEAEGRLHYTTRTYQLIPLLTLKKKYKKHSWKLNFPPYKVKYVVLTYGYGTKFTL